MAWQNGQWWRTREVEAEADRVWDLLVDLEAWPQWGPTVAGARLDDGTRRLSEGATGSVQTSVRVWLPFAITTFDHDPTGESAWSWRVAGVPATTHTVVATGPGRCRVSMGAPAWAPAYLAVLDLGLRRLAELAEQPDRSDRT